MHFGFYRRPRRDPYGNWVYLSSCGPFWGKNPSKVIGKPRGKTGVTLRDWAELTPPPSPPRLATRNNPLCHVFFPSTNESLARNRISANFHQLVDVSIYRPVAADSQSPVPVSDQANKDTAASVGAPLFDAPVFGQRLISTCERVGAAEQATVAGRVFLGGRTLLSIPNPRTACMREAGQPPSKYGHIDRDARVRQDGSGFILGFSNGVLV